ncbi:MAG TPA: hypothetical protein VG097_19835 [Gemmata sp.]|jgi:hypothetical protein|nr:hypothetical protein [Gemmata sp.]
MIGHSRSFHPPGYFLAASLALTMFAGKLHAADDEGKKEEEARREQQLKVMKCFAELYTLSHADDRKRLYKLHENAIMRFSNPVGGTKDGAVYLWSDRGQPQAVLKIFTYDNEVFVQEWQSLSESPLVAEREGKTIWNPAEPGIAFRELPEAPKPADSTAERLRQMKSLAGKFSTTYTAGKETKPDELRLLIQPLFRHEADAEMKRLDGAVFAFSQSTAPMGFLLFEARRNGESHRYYYAFARLSTQAMTARYGDKEIYSVEKYDFKRDPKQTFLQLPRQSAPNE